MILAFAEHLSFLLTTHAAPGDVNSGLCGDSPHLCAHTYKHTHTHTHTRVFTEDLIPSLLTQDRNDHGLVHFLLTVVKLLDSAVMYVSTSVCQPKFL